MSKLTLVMVAEEGFFDEGGDGFVGLAQAAGMMGIGGHAFEAVEDEFLKGLDIGGFAADTHAGGAPNNILGLFALVTKHSTSKRKDEFWISISNYFRDARAYVKNFFNTLIWLNFAYFSLFFP